MDAYRPGGGWTPLAVHGVTVGRRVVDWGLAAQGQGVTSLRWRCTATLGAPTDVVTVNLFGAYIGAPIGCARGGC